MNIFLKAYWTTLVLSVHAQMQFLGCLVKEKNNLKFLHVSLKTLFINKKLGQRISFLAKLTLSHD